MTASNTESKIAANTKICSDTNLSSGTNAIFDPETFLSDLKHKYGSYQPDFIQAVEEVAESLEPLFRDPLKGEFYQRAFLSLTEPERIISFRVPWVDDEGITRFNRGWRVEFCSALGPYKGGLRFHPTVTEGVLKFLGFEQVFKNALTGLPLGGGKGGSDFDPKGKSDTEIRRFCQSFMTELARYIGPSTDVPAGDIGVGGREIGYLYGAYKRIQNRHADGVLTGKSLLFGGSPLRPEATGHGVIYIAETSLKDRLNTDLKGKRCAVSGSGNVAQYACEKLLELGALVVSVSDSNGTMVFPQGMSKHDYREFLDAKQIKRSRLSSLTGRLTGKYIPNESPWSIGGLDIDIAFPCATQNEIDESAAKLLVKKNIIGLFEGASKYFLI